MYIDGQGTAKWAVMLGVLVIGHPLQEKEACLADCLRRVFIVLVGRYRKKHT